MNVNQLSNLTNGVQTGGVQPSGQPFDKNLRGVPAGPSFQQTLEGLSKKPTTAPGASASSLVFSKHAVERLQSRGITMGPERMARLETAFNKASAKGSRDTLVLLDGSAFIMNVKNKTIVTAMDQSMLKENLFTNIDSTIIV